MSDETHRYIDLALKVATPVGVFILLLLQTQFVSRTDFTDQVRSIQGRMEKVETLLIRMEAGSETDTRHQKSLEDHEERIRFLEKKA